MRPFLIDTDTASDDAVALIMALRWPGVAVKAITVVAGNMPLEQGARNARLAVELCGADVPISLGAGKPLLRANAHAEWFHGQDGLSDVGYAPREARFAPQHAVDTIIDTVKAHPGIELVTLGPLTNVALAVTRAPEIVPLVGRCVVMGGAACTEGNVTPAAEYNIWVDPEAARIVFHSGLPLEMVGWEHCRHDKVLSAAEIAHIQAFNTPLAEFAIRSNEAAIRAYHVQTGEDGLSLADPVAMAVALDPAVAVESSLHYVDVETQSELTRGMTVVDRLGVAQDARNRSVWAALIQHKPNVRVIWKVDAAHWKSILYYALQ
ncbi:nucleoside hydrolase [Aggregatilineales bacterium SYSU G02658]